MPDPQVPSSDSKYEPTIYRHKQASADSEVPGSDEAAWDVLDDHLNAVIGGQSLVFHEIVSEYVHIDVYMFQPTAARDCYTLVTHGMSDRPMAAPEGAGDVQYAELMLCLPPSWPLNNDRAFRKEENYWPVRWLKYLARFPHVYNTWLGYGHTVPNGDPARPFASNTQLCCAWLSYPRLFGAGLDPLTVAPGRTINFYSLVPLYPEEIEYKLTYGGNAFASRMNALPVTELLDIARPNACR